MDIINYSKIKKVESDLSEIMNYQSVSAVSNTYTLDISKNYNFAIETTDTNAKTIAFSNVPSGSGLLLQANVGLKYTNASAITFPASVVWQNGNIPTFTTGKFYELLFTSRDNGITWRGSYAGAW